MLSILPIHSCVTAWTFCNDSAAVFTTVRTNVVGFPVSMLTFNRLGRDITLARLIVASEEPAIACRDSSTPIIVNASCSSHIEINLSCVIYMPDTLLLRLVACLDRPSRTHNTNKHKYPQYRATLQMRYTGLCRRLNNIEKVLCMDDRPRQ